MAGLKKVNQTFPSGHLAASALNHPNILTIHEIGELEGQNYIAQSLSTGSLCGRV
jgi:hypothetical protein